MKKNSFSLVSAICVALLSLAFISCSHDPAPNNAPVTTTPPTPQSYGFQGHEYYGEIENGYYVVVTFYSTGNNGIVTEVEPSGSSSSYGCTYTVNGNTVTMSFGGESELFMYYPNEDGFRWGPYWLGRND